MGRGDLLKEGSLWQRNCAAIINLIGDDLPLGTTIAAGTYTPTLTNVANLDGSTASICLYSRVGTVVTVSGVVNINPTAGATITQLGISLPVASAFANTTDCAGTACAVAVAAESGSVFADATNDRANLHIIAASTADHAVTFTFQYRIL